MRIECIMAAEALPLRQQVPYAGRALEGCWQPQDERPDGIHLGVFDRQEIIGIGSFFLNGTKASPA